MARRSFDYELVARNYQLSMELYPEVIKSWDSDLWRGPRLLVPIRLEALVVTEENADGPWAKVKLNPHAIPGYSAVAPDDPDDADGTEQPAPFETYTGREIGVHLHWALPDGLTHGLQDDAPEEAPPDEEEIGQPEHQAEETEQDVAFPIVPDRWLVVRMFPGATEDDKRRATAWVIESEEHDPAKRVTPLSWWREDRSEEHHERWLTAVGKGDPAYAAYYDNVQGVLGFHDSLEHVPTGPLAYLVVGWYSQVEDDPLYRPPTREAWLALLDELGWTLEGELEDQEERIEQAALDAQERLAEAGVWMRFDLSDEQALIQNAPVAAVTPGMTSISDASEVSTVTAQTRFLTYWPRQLLCHGMITHVAWNGPSERVPGPDGRPSDAHIAVGNTSIEALSALIADRGNQPNLAKVAEAFHYGMLSALDESDGLAALESLLHSEDFASRPGGFVVEHIAEGDIVPRVEPRHVYAGARAEMIGREIWAESIRASDATRLLRDRPGLYGVSRTEGAVSARDTEEKKQEKKAPHFSYQQKPFLVEQASLAEMMAEHVLAPGAVAETEVEKHPRRLVPVRRAMPRYYEPKDPLILLAGAGRSMKHGEDGYFNQDDKLVCRVTGETIDELAIVVGRRLDTDSPVRATVTTADITTDELLSGQIPPEVGQLYHEALFLDHGTCGIAARSLAQQREYLHSITPPDEVARHDLSVANLELKILIEQTLPWRFFLVPVADPEPLAEMSGLRGKVPSAIAHTIWMQPWTPLHLAWEVVWHPSPQGERDWTLGEHDFDPLGDAAREAAPEQRVTYRGRTLLTPAITAVLADRIRKFLEVESASEQDLATETEEGALGAVLEELRKLDVLSTSLGGLHDLFIDAEETYEFTPAEGEPTPEEPTTAPSGEDEEPLPLFPVRAGHLRLKRLRVIDAFGRMLDIPEARLNAPIRAEDVVATEADMIQMPPRIVQPARLMFRLRQADDDTLDATKQRSPICGWLLPDHLDEALEVFDPQGINQGQLQLAPDGQGVAWQGVPGRPGPLGGPPQVDNQHVMSFVQGLLSWGTKDSVDRTSDEPVLSALLRMIDATLWTVDPLGREGDEHLSVILGRPLAVVRAHLRLELEDEPVTPELLRTPFPVRLGALTCLHDGLIGYFVNDDYSQFYPVHETIADQARPTRPHHGFLGAIQTVPGFYQSFGRSETIEPVTHSYINREPTVKIRPGQTVMLTLLIDPRGGVHATAGILPRKRIELMREHVSRALDNIAVTFRIGPVLTDPETIRMPLPAEIKGAWSWVRRTGPTVWKEDPVVNATEDAQLSPTPAHISEGWLKVTGPLREEEEETSGAGG